MRYLRPTFLSFSYSFLCSILSSLYSLLLSSFLLISSFRSLLFYFIRSVVGGSHDLSALSIPGRVFFIKNRKLNKVCVYVCVCLCVSVKLTVVSTPSSPLLQLYAQHMQYLFMTLRATVDPSLPARQLPWHSPPPIITCHHACPVLSRLILPYLVLPYRTLHCTVCPVLPCRVPVYQTHLCALLRFFIRELQCNVCCAVSGAKTYSGRYMKYSYPSA